MDRPRPHLPRVPPRRSRARAPRPLPPPSLCASSWVVLLLPLLALVDADVVDELADHPLEDHRRLRESDVLAALEQLRIAAELELDVAIAEHARGDDRGRGVGRQRHARIEIE